MIIVYRYIYLIDCRKINKMNIHTEFKNENQLNQLNYSVNLIENNNKLPHPIHIQNLEKALNLNSFLKQVHSLIDDKRDEKLSSTISKQQSKDVKSSIYSFNKTAKNKNWLKNILIDNSDESDDNIEQDVAQLLKIRKNCKKSNKINSNISSNLLSLSDSIPLNSLFKNDKISKSSIKKKTNGNSKKKLKASDDSIKEKIIDTNDKLINYDFEPTLNSKSFNKHDNDLIDTDCLESKLLEDLKYESALPDDLLQGESNMNDFVNSYLPNMNDQIVYSNQLPDEIFETEEEISNGFRYDLNKLTNKEETDTKKINQPTIDNSKCVDIRESDVQSIIESLDHKVEETKIVQIVNSISSNTNPVTTNTVASDTAIISFSSSANSLKTIESFDTVKPQAGKQTVKKKEKLSNKSSLEIEPEQLQNKRRKLWLTIVKKEIPRAYKLRLTNRKEMLRNCKRLASSCSKERKNLIGIPKLNRECFKKSSKEMATYRRNDNQEIKRQLLSKIGEQTATTTITFTATPTTIKEIEKIDRML